MVVRAPGHHSAGGQEKKNFEDSQKAAKDAFEQQNKANREQCKSLPK